MAGLVSIMLDLLHTTIPSIIKKISVLNHGTKPTNELSQQKYLMQWVSFNLSNSAPFFINPQSSQYSSLTSPCTILTLTLPPVERPLAP